MTNVKPGALVAYDDPDVRMLLVEACRTAGFAARGVDRQELLDEYMAITKVDLVILDDTARDIPREWINSCRKDCTLWLFTSRNSAAYVKEMHSLGITRIFQLPVDLDLLIDALYQMQQDAVDHAC